MVEASDTLLAAVLTVVCNVSFRFRRLPSQEKRGLMSAGSGRPHRVQKFQLNCAFASIERGFYFLCDWKIWRRSSRCPVSGSSLRRRRSTEIAALIVLDDSHCTAYNCQLTALALLGSSSLSSFCILTGLSDRFCVDSEVLKWSQSYLSGWRCLSLLKAVCHKYPLVLTVIVSFLSTCFY